MADLTITQLSNQLLALPSVDAQLDQILVGVDNLNNVRSEKVSLKTIKDGIQTVGETNITTGSPSVPTGNRALNFGFYNLTLNQVNSFNVTGAADFLFTTTDFEIGSPTPGQSGKISLKNAVNLEQLTLSAHPDMASDYGIQFPQNAPTSDGQVMIYNTDGSTSYTSLAVTGQYRGTLTLSGGSPNLPDQNDGTIAVGDPLVAGDYWRIAANGTLDDGVDTTAVTAGQLLIVEDAAAAVVGDFSVVGTSGSDTNLFTTNLTSGGDRSHAAAGYSFGILNMNVLTLQANEIGVASDQGQAFYIAANRQITMPGYALAAQDATLHRTLGVDINGLLVSGDVPPATITVAYIRLESSLAAEETLNIQTALDGAGIQHTLKAESVGTFSLASLPTQASMAANPHFSCKVNGLEADKTNDPAAWLSVVRESDTEISFEANTLPAGTIIELTLLS